MIGALEAFVLVAVVRQWSACDHDPRLRENAARGRLAAVYGQTPILREALLVVKDCAVIARLCIASLGLGGGK